MKKKRENKTKGKGITILLSILIGAACGVMWAHFLDVKKMSLQELGNTMVWTVLFFYAAILIQIVIHETGHLVFGLLTGYKFLSFRILGMMWMKQDGRMVLRHMRIPGTGGQCLMGPPDMKDGKIPVKLYLMGGTIFNAVSAPLFLVLALACPIVRWGKVFLLFLAACGAGTAILNGMPLRLAMVNNDGKNALELTKNPEAQRALWIQLKVLEQTAKGVRVAQMPADWFVVPSDEAMKNANIATIGVLAANRLMDQQRFEEADALMAHLTAIDSGIVGLHRNLMLCDRIYIALAIKNTPEEAKALMTKEVVKIMKVMRNYPSALRTAYTYALLVEKNKAKADEIYLRLQKCMKTYPYPVELLAEQELVEKVERGNPI
ncbi:hypothetical protein SAMN02910358_00413 [Lachnospiraceae bacterium XBB1006]|nr:hypothetical protein SAMN02910358_00413 [Lachnospiraceae bacterium XBB1006]